MLVVHRDVKPDNLFLTGQGDRRVPMLLDFGLARVSQNAHRPTETPALTEVGVPGNPSLYARGTMVERRRRPRRGSVRLLAATFYELVTGRTEAPSAPMAAAMQHHLHAPAPSLADAGLGAAVRRRRVAGACARTVAVGRFGSMEAFLAAGDALFAAPTGVGRSAVARDRRRTSVMAIGLAVLPALAAAGYAGSHRPGYWIALAGAGVWPVLLAYILVLAWTVLAQKAFRWMCLPRSSGPLARCTALAWCSRRCVAIRWPRNSRS